MILLKFLSTYKSIGLNSESEVFDYFISNLKYTNRTFDFFVDWGKVFHNVKNIEVERQPFFRQIYSEQEYAF